MSKKILIVEDEEKLARFLELELQYEGYETDKSVDGREGLEKALSGDYDLILLDIMLPSLNGVEVLRRLRKTSTVPVIMLTARDSVVDKVTGLDGGADDYITKPFAIEELLARIRSALRATKEQKPKDNTLSLGEVTLDPQSYIATLNGEPLDLTKREFDLLEFMLENQGIVLSRDILLEKVWGYDYQGETNVVDVYIRFLRSKIDDIAKEKYIHTIRGVGYVMRKEE